MDADQVFAYVIAKREKELAAARDAEWVFPTIMKCRARGREFRKEAMYDERFILKPLNYKVLRGGKVVWEVRK